MVTQGLALRRSGGHKGRKVGSVISDLHHFCTFFVLLLQRLRLFARRQNVPVCFFHAEVIFCASTVPWPVLYARRWFAMAVTVFLLLRISLGKRRIAVSRAERALQALLCQVKMVGNFLRYSLRIVIRAILFAFFQKYLEIGNWVFSRF